ncbi:hypothetical protein CUT44_14125 [Streptomyces carminius]|uniref:DNA-binding protein n=1 Tax=Streptomyces carminius TaxID=2665496 RepID=A0A2M8LYV5_9ACTN|nr:hypothetical protein [Streptomyces carminius]PJE97115.1 hypothetical protein CUT44_14125 [Streptomyces carminius]
MTDDNGREWWTIAQVAAYLGVKEASARGQASRWGITRAHVTGASGRAEARYDAAEIREAHAARPGRGARTDRRPRQG